MPATALTAWWTGRGPPSPSGPHSQRLLHLRQGRLPRPGIPLAPSPPAAEASPSRSDAATPSWASVCRIASSDNCSSDCGSCRPRNGRIDPMPEITAPVPDLLTELRRPAGTPAPPRLLDLPRTRPSSGDRARARQRRAVADVTQDPHPCNGIVDDHHGEGLGSSGDHRWLHREAVQLARLVDPSGLELGEAAPWTHARNGNQLRVKAGHRATTSSPRAAPSQ